MDVGLVEVGALLHDIGRGQTHSIRHGVVGGEVARGLGLPGSVVRIVERHIGAGIPAGEATELGLPGVDFIPESLEEKLVAYADKLTDRGREIDFSVTVGWYERRHGRDHPSVGRLLALDAEMRGLLGG